MSAKQPLLYSMIADIKAIKSNINEYFKLRLQVIGLKAKLDRKDRKIAKLESDLAEKIIIKLDQAIDKELTAEDKLEEAHEIIDRRDNQIENIKKEKE